MVKGKTKKKISKKSWWCRGPFVITAAVVLSAICCMIVAYMKLCQAEYDGEEKVRIYIPAGATAEAISDTLQTRLGEKFGSKVYKIWSWRGGVPATATGSYVINPGERSLNVSRRLMIGAETPVRVTFNNVRTMPQLAERISRNMAFTADDFMAACDSVLPQLGYVKATFPAAFLPDTYEFYWSASPSHVVRRLAGMRDKYWSKERRAQASAMGLTPEDVATIASIVEEETLKADERPKVARLYLNRLKRGMKLQADPTVKFALGDFTLRRILAKHLQCDSPYNTYVTPGLPPGPIRIVERKTLDDVLYAPDHPYLYMCAKEDFSGYHNFAVTGAEHQRNAARYHAALNARNIR